MNIVIKTLLKLFIIIFCSQLTAEEPKDHSLYYLKFGVSHPPGDSFDVLPVSGLGIRFQKEDHGYDLSVNLASALFINYVSIKGVFLLYPRQEKPYPFYYGFGQEVGCYLDLVPMGQPFGGVSHTHGIIALEVLLGYEFRQAQHFKTFIQLELSQPICNFGMSHHRYQSGLALTAGIGF